MQLSYYPPMFTDKVPRVWMLQRQSSPHHLRRTSHLCCCSVLAFPSPRPGLAPQSRSRDLGGPRNGRGSVAREGGALKKRLKLCRYKGQILAKMLSVFSSMHVTVIKISRNRMCLIVIVCLQHVPFKFKLEKKRGPSGSTKCYKNE